VEVRRKFWNFPDDAGRTDVTPPLLLDFSAKPELRGLARVVGALQAVAAPLGVEFFLMGAAARDLGKESDTSS